MVLDDIAALDALRQWQVFHTFATGSVTRIGGFHAISIDVRFVFGTAADLPSLVQAGRFRRDFFAKLSGSAICLAPAADDRWYDPPEPEQRFRELSLSYTCVVCGTTARTFRQLTDGYFVCARCGQSFSADAPGS